MELSLELFYKSIVCAGGAGYQLHLQVPGHQGGALHITGKNYTFLDPDKLF